MSPRRVIIFQLIGFRDKKSSTVYTSKASFTRIRQRHRFSYHIKWVYCRLMVLFVSNVRARSTPNVRCQHWDHASDAAFIETNGVTPKWVADPILESLHSSQWAQWLLASWQSSSSVDADPRCKRTIKMLKGAATKNSEIDGAWKQAGRWSNLCSKLPAENSPNIDPWFIIQLTPVYFMHSLGFAILHQKLLYGMHQFYKVWSEEVDWVVNRVTNIHLCSSFGK